MIYSRGFATSDVVDRCSFLSEFDSFYHLLKYSNTQIESLHLESDVHRFQFRVG